MVEGLVNTYISFSSGLPVQTCGSHFKNILFLKRKFFYLSLLMKWNIQLSLFCFVAFVWVCDSDFTLPTVDKKCSVMEKVTNKKKWLFVVVWMYHVADIFSSGYNNEFVHKVSVVGSCKYKLDETLIIHVMESGTGRNFKALKKKHLVLDCCVLSPTSDMVRLGYLV